MSKKRISFILCFCIMILVQVSNSHVCNYFNEGQWTGRLVRCYDWSFNGSGSFSVGGKIIDITMTGGGSISGTNCIYEGFGYGSYGVKEYDFHVVNRC